ncbi:putative membrane protein [Cytobacillus firmus]|uniref:Putative membrane protein n=2 Tax=Cytobacillus TaxID=2675230 RepID=A0A366K0B8_CYTFI|nr:MULTISPECIES: cytochrome c oxidase assembly factor CtaG [Cytobacillus]RBP95100.1 putative membrane protein [Cytobacillus firmus]TDX43941.1 putative membrane protein [Cytobacillus oceanisediminis]
MSLEIFGFRALWSPYFFLFVLLILAGYYMITIKYRGKFKNSEPLTRRQGVYFTVAMIVLYVIKGSPVDLMGHLMFYAHMIQMAILYLVVPPLVVMGVPQWLWRAVINHKTVKPVFRLFTKPLIAIILFNGVFSIYHIPDVFDVVKTDMMLHTVYTSALFLLAIFMWWPTINELPEMESLDGLKKVGYVFANGVLLTPACALIIFADTPMYNTYSDPNAWAQALQLCVPSSTLASLNLSGPEMFNSMSLIHDQQLGGVIMKIIQEIVYGIILAQIFYAWYKKEQEITPSEEETMLNPHLVK